MESMGGDGALATAPLNQWRHDIWKLVQYYLDRTTSHAVYRWVGTFAFACLYALHVYYLQGFYFVSYGLGIYILNLLIGFLSPLVDPELETSDRPMLPTKGSDEFKPFIRRLPEFKFWCHKGFLGVLCHDILYHVRRPCLLAYFAVLLDSPICPHNETPNCAHEV